MATVSLIADFGGALVVANPVTAFNASGFDFASVDPMQTDSSAGFQGLGFARTGLRVTLPVVRDAVSLALLGAASPIRVQGLAGDGSSLVTELVDADHSVKPLMLKAANIASVMIDEGNNEGYLISIGIEVEIG